jgi:regulator of CtrA degradation
MVEREGSIGLTPKLIDSLYVEAMLLADEARAYFEASGRDDRLNMDSIDRVGFSCESLKVTTRLMHIIAWLLTQRAVLAGEISQKQAFEAERRLGDAPLTDQPLLDRLPEAATSLIRSSEELYERVRRLDQGPVAGSAPSPARTLLSRLQRSL